MKLVAIMNNKSIEIYRKKVDNDYDQKNALIRINYEQSLEFQIIRHSNTRLVIKAQDTVSNSNNPLDDSNETETQKNELHLTLESSYQRDVFALLLRKLNEHYLKEISKIDLNEVDFYKRREDYLERQLQKQITIFKENDQNNKEEIKMLKQEVMDKEEEITDKDKQME